MNKFQFLRPQYLFIALFLFAAFYIVISPLIVSIDSIQGFLAYKEYLRSGLFNYRAEVSPANINQDDFIFVRFWSPGQWAIPGLLSYLLHLKLGVSSVIVTILCAFSGCVGFYKVFRYFKFSASVSIYSLFIIFCSYTSYYCFIVYQGGEILSFGIFPWFLFYVLSINRPTIFRLLMVTILFVFCFLAKLTLMIYCPLVIACKMGEGFLADLIVHRKLAIRKINGWVYLVPIAVSFVLIYYSFLNKYPSYFPAQHFNADPSDVLIPVGSPLLSVLSLQQALLTIAPVRTGIYLDVLYLLVALLAIFALVRILMNRTIDTNYKSLILTLYLGFCIFFIPSYIFDSWIDQSARHFKLLGYLFVPGILTLVASKMRPAYLKTIVALITVFSVCAFVYLKRDWSKQRYTSNNYFYRGYDNKNDIDKLDKASYQRLMSEVRTADSGTIFFIVAHLDVAMDVPFRCIMPWQNLEQKYLGNGHPLVACVPKGLLNNQPNILSQKFPDYVSFQKIGDAGNFLFFKCR